MKELPSVSIVIVNYNGKKYLKDCFESLDKLSYPKDKYEIIMADNASTDSSMKYAKNNFPFVKVIGFNKNYGFAEGNNKAIEYTNPKSEYIAFLNNDTEVDKNWLIELIKPLIKDRTIGCSGNKILNYYDRSVIDSAGANITIIGTGYGIGHLKKDTVNYNRIRFIGYASGASMLIRKKLFNYLNGFDKDYFGYLEDTDIGWRLWLQGYKVLYVPTAVIYHKGGGSFGRSRNIPFRLYLGQKNRLFNIVKNLEIFNLFRGLISSIGYDIFRIIKFTINREFDCIAAILKGNYTFIKELSKTLKKRKIIQNKRKRSDKELYKFGVIATLSESIKTEFNLSKNE